MESTSHNRKEIPRFCIKNKLASRVGCRRLYDTNISHAWRWPPSALSKAFNTQTCYLTMGSTFFPSIDTARSQCKSFLSVETSGDHTEDALLNTAKYLVGVSRRSYADIGACRLLHEVPVECFLGTTKRGWKDKSKVWEIVADLLRMIWCDFISAFEYLKGSSRYHNVGYEIEIQLV